MKRLTPWWPLSLLCGMTLVGFADDLDPSRWEDTIREFESVDEGDFPEPVEILFLGSSSIKLWDLGKYFPGYQTLNRGFGGSQISDSLYYVDRLVFPYAPSVIVFYAGDNDIAAGKSPQTIFENYQALTMRIRKQLPDTRIVFVSIKPSLSRWHLVEKMREANRMIEEFSLLEPCLDYLDIDKLMIGSDGRPRLELFVEDGLHLSPVGYQLWSEALVPLVDSEKRSDCCGADGN